MDAAVVDELAKPAREDIRAVTNRLVLRVDLHYFVAVFREIDPQDLMVGIADGLCMRRYHDDKCGDRIFPHGPDGNDIDHLSKRVVVVDSLLLLLIAYGQKRTVRAGMAAKLAAGHTNPDMRGYLPYPLIEMQYGMIVFADDEDSGRRY